MTTDDQLPPRAAGAAPTPSPEPSSRPVEAAPGGPAPADPPDGPAVVDATAVPDEETLATIATPAVVRRAPRIGAFIRTGVLVGAVLGWLLAILFSGTTGEGRTGAILITTAAGAGFGALLGAGVAALLDRRGPVRPRAGRRRATR